PAQTGGFGAIPASHGCGGRVPFVQGVCEQSSRTCAAPRGATKVGGRQPGYGRGPRQHGESWRDQGLLPTQRKADPNAAARCVGGGSSSPAGSPEAHE